MNKASRIALVTLVATAALSQTTIAQQLRIFSPSTDGTAVAVSPSGNALILRQANGWSLVRNGSSTPLPFVRDSNYYDWFALSGDGSTVLHSRMSYSIAPAAAMQAYTVQDATTTTIPLYGFGSITADGTKIAGESVNGSLEVRNTTSVVGSVQPQSFGWPYPLSGGDTGYVSYSRYQPMWNVLQGVSSLSDDGLRGFAYPQYRYSFSAYGHSGTPYATNVPLLLNFQSGTFRHFYGPSSQPEVFADRTATWLLKRTGSQYSIENAVSGVDAPWTSSLVPKRISTDGNTVVVSGSGTGGDLLYRRDTGTFTPLSQILGPLVNYPNLYSYWIVDGMSDDATTLFGRVNVRTGNTDTEFTWTFTIPSPATPALFGLFSLASVRRRRQTV